MQIKRLVIENFKSIERIELVEPNPFTVFVGPNGSGKSNIFEALEYRQMHWIIYDPARVSGLFGGKENYIRRRSNNSRPTFEIEAEGFTFSKDKLDYDEAFLSDEMIYNGDGSVAAFTQFTNFTRLFVSNERLVKLNFTDDKRLTISASNMETVLKRLLSDNILNEEIHDWLSLFIPGFQKIEVVSGKLTGKDELLVYEQGIERPFTRNLISDGTYNILAMLTAVYQSEEPQFLCIEEPENGLHPEVLESLVNLFRYQCKEKGHYIWLNTHSESVVKCLTTDEIVLVNKRDGTTQTKQVKGMNIYDLSTDMAWLSGALGGGVA
jgi:predicted ATPase